MKKPKNKFILTGTDNDGFRHRYSVKKNEGFKKAFVKFMVELGFNEKVLKKEFIGEYSDKDDESGCYELKIKDIEDVCWHYQNKNYDVDVFHGRSRIIVVVRTKGRKFLVEYLEKKAGWIKPLEIKKIQKKRAKKEEIHISLQKNRSLK